MANEIIGKKADEIEVPKDYDDPILEHQHMVQKGEAVVTCKMAVSDPKSKVGVRVVCGGCGTGFDVVWEKAPGSAA